MTRTSSKGGGRMEWGGVTSQSRDPLGRSCSDVDRPDRNPTAFPWACRLLGTHPPFPAVEAWLRIRETQGTDSYLHQIGQQDSSQHMILGSQVQRQPGPIKSIMGIVHYLQLCLRRYSKPELTCLHYCSNVSLILCPPFYFIFCLDFATLGTKPMIT
jgi:hypothetical protein